MKLTKIALTGLMVTSTFANNIEVQDFIVGSKIPYSTLVKLHDYGRVESGHLYGYTNTKDKYKLFIFTKNGKIIKVELQKDYHDKFECWTNSVKFAIDHFGYENIYAGTGWYYSYNKPWPFGSKIEMDCLPSSGNWYLEMVITPDIPKE